MLKKLLATAVASLVLAAQATPLKTAQGDVEIAKVPERIVVYDIGALDTLVALGLGDKIVGIPGENSPPISPPRMRKKSAPCSSRIWKR